MDSALRDTVVVRGGRSDLEEHAEEIGLEDCGRGAVGKVPRCANIVDLMLCPALGCALVEIECPVEVVLWRGVVADPERDVQSVWEEGGEEFVLFSFDF